MGGFYVGVPVILGAGGVEKVVEIELTEQEKADFQKGLSFCLRELLCIATGLDPIANITALRQPCQAQDAHAAGNTG